MTHIFISAFGFLFAPCPVIRALNHTNRLLFGTNHEYGRLITFDLEKQIWAIRPVRLKRHQSWCEIKDGL